MLPRKFLDFHMMHLYCSFGSVFNFMSTVDTVWLGVGRKRLCFCSKHLLLLPDLHSWRCSDTPSSVATNWAWDSPKSHQKYPKFVGQNRAEKYCGISSKTSSGLTLTKVVQDILEQRSLAKQPSNLAVTSRLKLVNDQGRTLFISSFSSLGNSSNWGNGMSNKESTTMLAAMWWCTQALLCFEPKMLDSSCFLICPRDTSGWCHLIYDSMFNACSLTYNCQTTSKHGLHLIHHLLSGVSFESSSSSSCCTVSSSSVVVI